MATRKATKRRKVKTLLNEPAPVDVMGSYKEFEYKAVKVAADIADRLNEAFTERWRISQTFTFSQPVGLNAALYGTTADNNVVVILEREKL